MVMSLKKDEKKFDCWKEGILRYTFRVKKFKKCSAAGRKTLEIH